MIVSAARRLLPAFAAIAVAAWLAPGVASAQDSCKRGDLDAAYCDEDGDLVADAPKDRARWKNPDTLLYANSPLEDPAVYEKLMEPFVQHLSQCTGKRVRFYSVLSNAAAVEAMRSGRMHIGNFSTGDTMYAVQKAGAIPLAVRGDSRGIQGYHLVLVVRASSPFRKPSDLKGRKVAHVAPSSNSGHMAPVALLPAEGLTPGRDYTIAFSGKHENSVEGVAKGDYDAAAVADDVLIRMSDRGVVKRDDFRIIYTSPKFPPGALSVAHDLAPELRSRIADCTFAFRYPEPMMRAFQGADRWVPVRYRDDWEVVRRVAAAAAAPSAAAAPGAPAPSSAPPAPR